MFKGMFGGKGKKEKGKKTNNVRGKKAEQRKSRKSRKQAKSNNNKRPKAAGTDPANPKKNLSVEKKKKQVEVAATQNESTTLNLKHRRKKGKRPEFKKVVRPKRERKKGTVKRSGDKFYPGDSDFRYTSPKEIWVTCLGQPRNTVDLGNEARLLPDSSISLTQKKLQM